ncbi:unnamed protein product, partial [Ectocarpus sp. 8 AP-2014]
VETSVPPTKAWHGLERIPSTQRLHRADSIISDTGVSISFHIPCRTNPLGSQDAIVYTNQRRRRRQRLKGWTGPLNHDDQVPTGGSRTATSTGQQHRTGAERDQQLQQW